MANPTTNYGWPMPTSSDLVTDLPADFDAFGQPVDNTLKALNPETTLGDISYRSAVSNTNTRLGIGTAGQVLSVSGGVPAWTTTTGGGMTLISSGNLSGSANIAITSIPATYKNLQLWIKDPTWATDNYIGLRLNGDTGSNYAFLGLYNSSSSAASTTFVQNDSYIYGSSVNDAADANTFALIEIFDYANTNTRKMVTMTIQSLVYDRTFVQTQVTDAQWYATPAAINEVNIVANANYTGGTYEIYGVN
jgi:hypothetical protein